MIILLNCFQDIECCLKVRGSSNPQHDRNERYHQGNKIPHRSKSSDLYHISIQLPSLNAQFSYSFNRTPHHNHPTQLVATTLAPSIKILGCSVSDSFLSPFFLSTSTRSLVCSYVVSVCPSRARMTRERRSERMRRVRGLWRRDVRGGRAFGDVVGV